MILSTSMEKRDIKDFTLQELEREMENLREPSFRAKQIFSWIYRKGTRNLSDFTDLPLDLREKLQNFFFIGRLELAGHHHSGDGTEKILFRLGDGNFIETVLIPASRRKTICLSTQVGCKFGCLFCASGLRGFLRNLSPSEITEQILFFKHRYKIDPTNFVFMGMGEPLDNIDNVEKAVLIMNSPHGMAVAARRITISTCGVVPGIERLKKLDLQINLSISLHAADDGLRDRLVPVNRKHPLGELIRACEGYLQAGGRKLTLEYVMIREINDCLRDADGLAAIAVRLKAKVNLIPCSPVEGLAFAAPSAEAVEGFIKRLEERKVSLTLRRSKGVDIRAACGQLAGKFSWEET